METPANATACPTVGANCRGGVTADAIGWLKLGLAKTLGESGEGVRTQEARMKNNEEQARTNKNEPNQETTKHTTMYPASGPSCGGNTPTAALS